MTAFDRAVVDEDLRGAAALVFVEDLDELVPSEEDAHHLVDVLRLRLGARVALSDGKGSWRLTEVSLLPSTTRRKGRTPVGEVGRLELTPCAETRHCRAPLPELTMAFAIPKGDRFDLIIQKLTELGIDHMVPLLTKRTVVRVESGALARRSDRIARIAREAASQSRRLFLPVVHEPQSLEAFFTGRGGETVVAEPGGPPMPVGTQCVVVGPEGGWEIDEIPSQLARVGLGPTILRAETAAITAGALLMAVRSGVVGHG